MPYAAKKAMEYLDKPAIHETMTKAIEGPHGVYVIEVLTEGNALALVPVGEQENGVKVLPSPYLVLSTVSRSMPTRSDKSSSKYVGMLQFSTSLTSLEPRWIEASVGKARA
ncbi:hypothetical protein Tco_0450867 [Tanacetum coccineum]